MTGADGQRNDESEEPRRTRDAAPDARTVLVVGAGIGGLAAAYRLQKLGYAVTLFEKEERAGGRMRSLDVPSFLVPDPLNPAKRIPKSQDVGAQFLNSGYRTLLSLVRDIGADPLLGTLEADYLTRKRGSFRSASPKDPATLMDAGLISSLEGWQVKQAFDAVVRETRGLALDDHAVWDGFESETAARWLAREYGKTAADYLGYPAIETLFFYRPEETSEAIFRWIIANTAGTSDWSTARGGVGRVAELLAKKLEGMGVRIVYGANVAAVSQEGDRVRVRLGSGDEVSGAGAIVATPGPISARLVSAPSRAQAAVLENPYASTMVVNLHMSRPAVDAFDLAFPAYVAHVPRVERGGGAIAGFSIESGKYGESEQHLLAGHEIYGLHLADAGARALLGETDAEVLSTIRREWIALGADGGRELGAVVQRWPHAIPMSPVGRSRILRDLWRAQEDDDNRVLLCGDQTTFATMDAAARSGHRAATLLAAKL